MEPTPSRWHFLRTFHWRMAAPQPPRWEPCLRLVESARADLKRRTRGLEHELARWDDRLRDLGGDPSRSDWRSFRPLRLSREEDWSDWLGYLLLRSDSGRLAAGLFGGDPSGYLQPRELYREWWLRGGKVRPDIVVRLRDGDGIHVEVKTGDEQFWKTYSTAQAVHDVWEPGHEVRDFILLPEQSEPAWAAVDSWAATEGANARPAVHSLTWRDVAVSLRHALWERDETVSWLAFAHAFCGAVEQILLNHPRVPDGQESVRHLSVADLEHLASLVDVARRGRQR